MHILVIWTIVSFNTYDLKNNFDWRSIGEFSTKATCQSAAANLGYTDHSKFRCIAV